MKLFPGIVIGFAFIFSICACNNRKGRNYNNVVDAEVQNFVTKGIEGGNAEIQLSQLALKVSKNKAITDYANAMIAAHTDAGTTLKQIATDQKAAIPDTLTKVHTQAIAIMSKDTGSTFDKAYIQAMVQDHEQSIALYKTVTGNSNKKITDFAGKALPKLKEHLEQANAICARLE